MQIKWTILLVVLFVALIVIARKPKSAVDHSGTEFVVPKPLVTANDRLTVATYNIQTGKSASGERDVSQAAAVIADADIVGIQEVYAPSWLNWLFGSPGQVAVLADNGGFGALFSATRRRWFREHRGNAILSKLPISSWRVTMLPDQSGDAFRNMTVATLLWQEQTVHLINTHLHTSVGREQQLEIVLEEFKKYPYAILLGDFNSRPDEPLLLDLVASGQAIDAITEAEIDIMDTERIDWILTKGFKVVSGASQEKGVSDHPYYQVSLTLLPN